MDNRAFHRYLMQWATLPGDIEEQGYFMSVYPACLDDKLAALSTLYLAGDARQQEHLRQFFASEISSVAPLRSTYARFDNVLIYMRRVSRCIRTTADKQFLRLGLSVAAYTEGWADSHDLLVSLAFLYYAAARAEIDPVPFFDAAAASAGPLVQEALRAFLHCEASTVARIVHHYEGTC